MQKTLIIAGLLILVLGLIYPLLEKLGLGHMPGDIFWKDENSSFYFPIVTCVVISVILSIILNLFK